LEDAVGGWLDREVVLFNSGFVANTGAIPALFGRGDRVASDTNNHASIIDGLRLSRAEIDIIMHNDFSTVSPNHAGLVIESLYSMDGDVAPLKSAPAVPCLMVDEAHAVGCLGPEGRGWCAHLGVSPDVMVGTFGKAFGAAGAFVAGPTPLRSLLINTARTLIFSTGLPESVASAALAGWTVAMQEPDRRETLAKNAACLRRGLQERGWRPLGDAHIVPVVVGEHAMQLADHLLTKGFYAAGIRPPTVPAGTERIRLTVSAAHTFHQIEALLDAFGTAGPPEEPWTPR
jgi:7-keto-8-aminopelargonate synthetase-like enzyme